MNPAQLERLREQLTRLRLLKSRERLDALLQEAAAKELSYADFLDQVLGEEVAAKAEKNITMRTSLARFPFVKSLEAFDFTYQPSLDKKHLQQVATCHFIEHGENVVLLGPPGVGKSHLAIGLGLKAIEQGYRVLFTTAAAMIATLTRALTENRLEDKLKIYTIPRLLIIDEIGYLPIDRTGANLFFQLNLTSVREGADDSDEQPKLWRLGRGIWGPGARDGDPGSSAPPRDHDQYPRALLPTQRETQGRTGTRRGSVNGNITEAGNFRAPNWGKLDAP